MSGEVRIPVSLKFDVNSSIWQDTVSELRSSRMLSTIILLLLELYHDNDDVRQMIDSRAVIDSHVDFEALSKQLERISNSHKEALVATGLLRGTVSTSYSELDSKVSMLGTKLDAVLSVIQGLGGISLSSVAQGALLGSGVGGGSTDGSEAVLGASGGISGGVSPMASGLVLSDGSLDGSLGGGGVFDGVSVASGGSVSVSTVSVGGSGSDGSGTILGVSGAVSGGYSDSVLASQGGTDSVLVDDEGSDSGEDEDDEGVVSGAALASMQKLLGSLRK